MKAFVTGVAGQLGHDVVNELTKRGHQAVGSDIAPTLESCASYVPLDITDAAAVEQTIMQVQPDAIVHCAAWTAVDAAGKSQSHQRRWNETYCGRSEKSRCQNGLYQHRLCV